MGFRQGDTSGVRHLFCPLKACGDCGVDVKGKIGIAVKRLEIKGFKTKGSIFECCFWSFFFLSVETCRKAENGSACMEGVH